MAIDKIIEAIDTKLNREVDLFTSEFENILRDIERLVAIRSVQLMSDPLGFDFEFQKILQETGYYSLVNNYIDNSYDKSYKEILALFKEGGLAISFSADDLASIAKIKELDLQAFTDIGNNAAQRLKGDLYKYTLSDMKAQDIVENIKNSLGDTDLAKYSKTYADTSISNYNQSIIDMKSAEVEDEVYIYRGVTDKKTRRFCQCVIKQKKYYSKSDADALRNDKRRQWNCRHLVIPVSLEYAKNRGYEEGSFTC